MSVRSAIERTLYIYGWAFDEDNIDLVADCFTQDAVLKVNGADVVIKGRAAIRKFYDDKRQVWRSQRQQTRHLYTNVIVNGESQVQADVLSYVLVVTTESGANRMYSRWNEPMASSVRVGWHRDRMVNQAGAWRFKERIINIDVEYHQTAFEQWIPAVAQVGTTE